MSQPSGHAGDEFVRRFPTLDAYLAHHQAAGHICCHCPQQKPARPCCNAGHDEAERLKAEFNRITTPSES